MTEYGPHHIDIFPWMKWKASSNYSSITRVVDSTSLGMGRMTAADGSASKHVEWDVALISGTWTFTLIYTKVNSAGILTPSLDGSDLSTLDMYNSTNSLNLVQQWTGISISTGGVKELKFRTDTKNASSSNYNLFIQLINFTRTGS